jgi:hypothetical protein
MSVFLFLNICEIKGEIIFEAGRPPENASNTGEFIKWDEWGAEFVLNLPYEIGEDVEYVFDKDTPYAIDIIEIRADGEKLSFALELLAPPYSRNYARVKRTIEGKREYYMSMDWTFGWVTIEGRRGWVKALFWNDGTGFMFKETEPDYGVPWTNSYQISDGMEILEITYRIILPYPSLTLNNLRDRNYENKIYTEEYTITIDISNLFTEIDLVK